MSQRNRNPRRASHMENRGVEARREDNRIYIYGSTAPQLELQRQFEEPLKKPDLDARKNRERAHHMSAGYVLFLGAALVASALILVNYLQLQAELTNLTRSVASRQSALNELRDENDEEYNRIVTNIDLEEIRRVAMGVLGMVYAREGQILIYEGERYDYMRQVTENGR